MSETYPSDRTDEEWAVVGPPIPPSHGGHPRAVDIRLMVNGIFHRNKLPRRWVVERTFAGLGRCRRKEKEGGNMVREIDAPDLAARLAAGETVYLLDVRQPWEHETAALPGSRLLPLDQLPVRAGEVVPPPGVPVVVYCHHGIRSRSAAALLERRGLSEVYSLAGGIDAWSVQVDPKVPRY